MKVLIFGLPGAGKTNLSQKLSNFTGIPVFHVDKHFFEHDWRERPIELFYEDVSAELGKEQWIIDGNAMASLESRFCEADVAIYYHFSRLSCLFRLFYRKL